MSEKYENETLQKVNMKFKEEGLWPDFFACTFYSMITKYKDQSGLKDEEAAEYYFESLFILMILTVCCVAILLNIHWDSIFVIHDNYPL